MKNKLINLNINGLTPKLSLNKKTLSEAILVAADAIGYKTNNTKLNILFTSDRTIAEFHQKFLNDKMPTDVISFPMEEIDPLTGEYILGDLLISKETAIREAIHRKIPIQKELILYAIHGFLHLTGFDDHSVKDRRKMTRKQNEILKIIFP